MSKQEYAWLVALAALAVRGKSINTDDDQENPGPLMQSVYAKAGTFSNAPASSSNDLAAVLLVLLFIFAWNRAKYLAFFGVSVQKRAVFFQNNTAVVFYPYPAESRIVASLPGMEGRFFPPPGLCQMITTPTLEMIRREGAGMPCPHFLPAKSKKANRRLA